MTRRTPRAAIIRALGQAAMYSQELLEAMAGCNSPEQNAFKTETKKDIEEYRKLLKGLTGSRRTSLEKFFDENANLERTL